MCSENLDFGDYFIICLKFVIIIWLTSLSVRAYESDACGNEWAVPPFLGAILLGVSLMVYVLYEIFFIRRFGFLTVWQLLLIISIIITSNINNINNMLTSTCDITELNNISTGIVVPVLIGLILFIFSLKSFDQYTKIIKEIEKTKSKKVIEPEELNNFSRIDYIVGGVHTKPNQLKL
jgi:hypothetical protein